ncbi:Transglutaminase-like superfamily protein [Saccharicrinis carchari]|uniref:Transglutaminase-like superfamily protein n=1 Tax=Saccharicrinis carchari TaxID=1168039 RepID=A0A521AJK2_SACCC|nr:DUF3857 domain-containing protein [Saccharicrinis carchari]SMO34973.1 Transglutaminase-like superfamily protein [Saccharicrinis carchari]
MNLLKVLLTLVILFTITICTHANRDRMRFGKIDQSEIEMTVCPIDSNAGAVVLGAFGYTEFKITEKDIFTEFNRHVRIKIFNKESFEKGNFSIYLYKSRSGNEEKLMGLKGVVYNLKDGKLEKTKLKKDNIFKEELNSNHNVVKVAMPNIQEGSILELSYLIQSPYIYNLQNWRFQDDIPTLYSEYQVDVIEWYHYKNWTEGYIPIEKTQNTKRQKFSFRTEATINPGLGGANGGRVPARTVDFDAEVTQMTYTATNVPAFKNEPHITTPKDYLSSVQFELQSTRYPWDTYKNYTTDWQTLNKKLLDGQNFGLTLNNDGHLKDIAESIVAQSATPEQKACLAYEHINNKMVWDGTYRTQAGSSIRKAYNDSKGHSSDINLNLIALCRKIGLQADPVLVSTRDHGMVRPGLISLSQFNHVIAAVIIDDQRLLMDATDVNCPYNLLPANSLNGKGRLVIQGEGEWVDLYTQTAEKEMYMANLIMDNEFNLSGSLTYKADDYGAVQFRKKYNARENEESFITWLEEEIKDAKISDFKMENLDSLSQPVVFKANISLKNRINAAGDMAFLNPKVINRMVENIFKREERTYPVDYNYPIQKQFVIRITVPEGYAVDELPEKMAVALPNNAGKYVFVTATQGRTIQLTNQYHINQTIFPGTEYATLKKFNEMIVGKEAEQVVIKKI